MRNPAAGENRGVHKDVVPVCANFWKIRKETTLNSLSNPETVGLLAGWGQFPVEFAKKAKIKGYLFNQDNLYKFIKSKVF